MLLPPELILDVFDILDNDFSKSYTRTSRIDHFLKIRLISRSFCEIVHYFLRKQFGQLLCLIEGQEHLPISRYHSLPKWLGNVGMYGPSESLCYTLEKRERFFYVQLNDDIYLFGGGRWTSRFKYSTIKYLNARSGIYTQPLPEPPKFEIGRFKIKTVFGSVLVLNHLRIEDTDFLRKTNRHALFVRRNGDHIYDKIFFWDGYHRAEGYVIFVIPVSRFPTCKSIIQNIYSFLKVEHQFDHEEDGKTVDPVVIFKMDNELQGYIGGKVELPIFFFDHERQINKKEEYFFGNSNYVRKHCISAILASPMIESYLFSPWLLTMLPDHGETNNNSQPQELIPSILNMMGTTQLCELYTKMLLYDDLGGRSFRTTNFGKTLGVPRGPCL
jgi:hypothetical protein